MKLSFLDNALWATNFILHVTLLFILFIRRNLKGFGMFKAALIWETILAAGLYLISKHASRHAYFLFYWIGGYFDYALQFAVIIAVCRDVLAPVSWWLRETRAMFWTWGTLAFVVVIGVSLGISRPGVTGFDLWEKRGNLVLLLGICGVLVVVTSIASFFHLYRRRQVLALGFGYFVIFYSVLLTDLADFILAGKRSDAIATYGAMCLYMAVLVYWSVKFWQPETEPPPPTAEMRAAMVALHEQVQYDISNLNGPRQ